MLLATQNVHFIDLSKQGLSNIYGTYWPQFAIHHVFQAKRVVKMGTTGVPQSLIDMTSQRDL